MFNLSNPHAALGPHPCLKQATFTSTTYRLLRITSFGYCSFWLGNVSTSERHLVKFLISCTAALWNWYLALEGTRILALHTHTHTHIHSLSILEIMTEPMFIPGSGFLLHRPVDYMVNVDITLPQVLHSQWEHGETHSPSCSPADISGSAWPPGPMPKLCSALTSALWLSSSRYVLEMI